MLVTALWIVSVVVLVMSLWAFVVATLLDAPVIRTVAQGMLDWSLWPSLVGCPFISRTIRASEGLPNRRDAG